MHKSFLDELESDIKKAYEEPVTIEQAELLAAKFLSAQIEISKELRTVELDSRMKKTGLKTVKANIYLEEASKGDKKPSDVMLGALVDKNPLVHKSQTDFDEADVDKETLHNYLNVFKEAHIYFRGISKGRFDG